MKYICWDLDQCFKQNNFIQGPHVTVRYWISVVDTLLKKFPIKIQYESIGTHSQIWYRSVCRCRLTVTSQQLLLTLDVNDCQRMNPAHSDVSIFSYIISNDPTSMGIALWGTFDQGWAFKKCPFIFKFGWKAKGEKSFEDVGKISQNRVN